MNPIETDKYSGGLPAVEREVKESIRRQRQKIESALNASPILVHTFIEQPLVGVFVCRNDKLMYVNEKCAEMFGYRQDDMLGILLTELMAGGHQAELADHMERLTSGESDSIHHEFNGMRKDGRIMGFEAHFTTMEIDGNRAVIGTLLQSAERNEAIEVTAIQNLPQDISHYFNNFLTIINGYSTLALRALEPGTAAYREIETILLAGERAAEQLKEFQQARTGYHGTFELPAGPPQEASHLTPQIPLVTEVVV